MFKKIVGLIIMIVLFCGSICGIYYGIKYHNIDNQVVEDSSGMVSLVDELRKSVSNLEEEKTTLTQQLHILQEQYDSLNQLRQKLEDTNNSLEIENAGLQKRFEELDIQNAELETQISDLNKQITNLNSQIDTLNKTLEDNKVSYDEEILNLQIQVTTLQAQVNSLNLTIDDLNSKINSYEEKTIELNTTIANLNNRIEEYEQEIENYKIIIEKLKEINSCVVTFYVDGEVYNVQQVKKTESPANIDNPSKDSYIFDGWTISGSTEIIDPFTYSVVEDVDFVASIRKNKIVTFSVDDVVVSTQSIIEIEELQLPEEPTKEHYSFLGWSIDGENVIDLNSYSIKGDTNFIAVFEVVGVLPYTFDGSTLTGYTGTDCEIVIPSSYSIVEDNIFVEGNDYQVNSIGDEAFRNNSVLNSVIIGDNIISIGSYTFSNCRNLISCEIGNNVVGIGDNCFYDCYSFANVIIGEKVNKIGKEVFANCKLKEVHFNANSLDSVGSNFSDYNFFDEGCIVYIGKNVTKVPGDLFSGIYANSTPCGVSKVIFEEGSVCEIIGTAAFKCCYNLTEINLPNTIKEIGHYAFYDCSSLSEIVIGENVTTLGNYAFYACTSVKNVYYNARLISEVSITQESSGNYIFGVDAENLIIGKNVEYLPNYLFHAQYQFVRNSFDNVIFEDGCILSSIGRGWLYNAFSYCKIGTIIIDEQNIYDNILAGKVKFEELSNELMIFFANGVDVSTFKIKSQFVDNNPISELEDINKYTKTQDGDYYIYTKISS